MQTFKHKAKASDIKGESIPESQTLKAESTFQRTNKPLLQYHHHYRYRINFSPENLQNNIHVQRDTRQGDPSSVLARKVPDDFWIV